MIALTEYWDRKLLDYGMNAENQLYCCQTASIDKHGSLIKERQRSFGAYINPLDLLVKWNYKEHVPTDSIELVPCVLGGAFHSPLMESAHEELAKAIESTNFNNAICPVYQNCDAAPHTDAEEIKANLIKQLTAPVRWTQSVEQMVADGASRFIEYGPGKVLQGLIRKIDKNVEVEGIGE